MRVLGKQLVLLVFMSLALAACGRSHSVSSADLRTALQDYYDHHPVCIALAFVAPAELHVSGIEPLRPQLQALTEAGLLIVAPVKPLNGDASSATRTAQQIRYRVAPDAESFVRKEANSFVGGTDLCFAQQKITKVESFSTPATVMGQTVSQVRYDFVLTDIAPWVRNEAIAQAFPSIKTALTQRSGQKTETMILTRQGWQIEHAAQ